MFWLLNLILLVIVNAQDENAETKPPAPESPVPTTPMTSATTSAGTAPTTIKNGDKPDDIDQLLKDILSTYEPDCQGNAELTSELDKIRFVLKLGDEYNLVKIKVLTDFKVYNALRLALEQRITERIDTLNDLLPTLIPNSKCSRFYLKQRKVLKEIGKLSNVEKLAKLLENSAVCPTSVLDYSDEDYFYFDDDLKKK